MRTSVATGFAALLLAGSVGASDENERLRPDVRPPKARADDRAERIRRAREEIRAHPEQRKFILFRHRLEEEDLR